MEKSISNDFLIFWVAAETVQIVFFFHAVALILGTKPPNDPPHCRPFRKNYSDLGVCFGGPGKTVPTGISGLASARKRVRRKPKARKVCRRARCHVFVA